MNVLEFARRYLFPYRQKGSEIIPTYCPYCKGGTHKDKYTFALNIDKQTFNCKRGSCGVQGHFTELCRDFGEVAETNYELRQPKQKKYKKPATVVNAAKAKVEAYLKLRGFSKETWERRKVGESNGNIAFPYYDENNELVFMKFRKPKKYTGNGQKAWREKDGKPILWGMNLCTFDKPLVIVEGEFDALALDECGIENVVSVPSGAEDLTWIEICWNWLEKFSKIIIWPDNDQPGQEMSRNVIARLGEYRCYIVQAKYKDANETMFREGKDKVKEYVETAKEVPVNGLLRLADVTSLDVTKIQRIRSNIKWIDREIGGWGYGDLSIWTGKRGEGKSTIIGQIILEAVDQQIPVCAYSGELRADRFQYWIHLQAAGKEYIKYYDDPLREKMIPYVDRETSQRIKNWYYDYLFLYDNRFNPESREEKSIIKLFTYAVKRYGCRMFVVDNLMTAMFNSEDNERDYYRRQANFTGKLKEFANAYNVHVHLVAHPKKTGRIDDNDDVMGSGDIPNLADNVFAIEKIEDKTEIDCDSIIKVMKNRWEGTTDKIGLMFDKDSKRFYQKSDPTGLYKKYGWVSTKEMFAEVDEPCPF